MTAERTRLQNLIDALRCAAPDLLTASEQLVVNRWAQRAVPAQPTGRPLVSVIIPVFNALDTTLRSLQSIADSWFESAGVQVIVVDDASLDRTSAVIPQVPGVTYVRRPRSGGFASACNRGARAAAGRYLCFLSSGVTVRDGWLGRLLDVFKDESVGACGAKLVAPDGRLHEAGAVVWRDGSALSYGRGSDPAEPAYTFRRDADYCSGACLLVRRDLFERLGGFDEAYVPGSCEDADFCFGVRALGYRVVYEPGAQVVYDDTSSSIDCGKEDDRERFSGKWAQRLANHFERSPERIRPAALARNGGQTVLVIAPKVPAGADSWSHRMRSILRLMRQAGYNVTYFSDSYAVDSPHRAVLEARGIQVLNRADVPAQQQLADVLPWVDAAWICGAALFEEYADLVRRNRAAALLYDAAGETRAPHAGDAIIAASAQEKRLFAEESRPVYIVPDVHDAGRPALPSANSVIFIGDYEKAENVEAALSLCTEIMPLVWEQLPNVHLALLGNRPPEALRNSVSERITVPGFTEDLEPYLVAGRVFAAPLRHRAALNGKVALALAHAMPCVLSTAACEGYDLIDERDCLVAAGAQEFASAILRVFNEPLLWKRLTTRACELRVDFTPDAVYASLVSALHEPLGARNGKVVTA